MADQRNDVTIPADSTLTVDNFSINSDGTVTVKNKELADALKNKLEGALSDPSTNAVSVGVVVGL